MMDPYERFVGIFTVPIDPELMTEYDAKVNSNVRWAGWLCRSYSTTDREALRRLIKDEKRRAAWRVWIHSLDRQPTETEYNEAVSAMGGEI